MKPYVHGQVFHNIEDWQNILLSDDEYELLDETDLQLYFEKLEEEKKPKIVKLEE